MSSAIQIWGGTRNETELGTGKLRDVSSRTSIMHYVTLPSRVVGASPMIRAEMFCEFVAFDISTSGAKHCWSCAAGG